MIKHASQITYENILHCSTREEFDTVVKILKAQGQEVEKRYIQPFPCQIFRVEKFLLVADWPANCMPLNTSRDFIAANALCHA